MGRKADIELGKPAAHILYSQEVIQPAQSDTNIPELKSGEQTLDLAVKMGTLA